jgi:hypothetical protein
LSASTSDDLTSVGQATASPLGEAVHIDDLSLTSLYLKLYTHAGGAEEQIGTATGFVVEHFGKNYLVTNWHVLQGRHPDTGDPLHKMCALPDEVRIACLTMRSHEKLVWTFVREKLLNADGSRRWVEHAQGEKVDVGVLELDRTPLNVMPWRPLDLALADEDLELYPSMPVSIIGFPAGLRANAFIAIWKTGHIASDPDILYKGLPAFLIDATTRGGMSGSIVVARVVGPAMTQKGFTAWSAVRTKFLGIYASRLPHEVEIGCIWRSSAILDVLNRAAGAPPGTSAS